MEEIFDKVASNYSYTYNQFLEQVTPRLAYRLIEIIYVRENNEYCYLAALHGYDKRKDIIKPRVADFAKPYSDEERDEIEKEIAARMEAKKHVKR